MQGSLEKPPIIVHESWLSWGGSLIVGGLIFAASLYLLLTDGAASPALAWFGVAAGSCFCVWRFFLPLRMEIWPDRFVWRGGFGLRREFAFAEIDEFKALFVGRGSWVVGFRFLADSPRRTKLAAVAEVLTGFDETIQCNWEISASDLADLLNRSRLLPSAWR